MKKQPLPFLVLIIYVAILVKVMVFKELPTFHIGSLIFNFAGEDGGHPANFIPFRTIVPYLLGNKGLIIAGVNLVGNIALLVPLGLLVPLIFQNPTWKKTFAVAFLSGLAIEILQSILHVGIFDIDDIILNGLGVIAGYGAAMTIAKWVRSRNYIAMLIASSVMIVMAITVFFAINPTGGLKEGAMPLRGNPCGDTSGTGKIISTGKSSIVIRRNDGVTQAITLESWTAIRDSSGRITASDLKVGQRVTLVVNDTKTASTVLVCGLPK